MLGIWNKGRFLQAYQFELAQQNPALFRQMKLEKTLKKTLKEVGNEAEAMFLHQMRFLMEKRGFDENQAEAAATEIVFHEMIQFSKSENLLEKLFKLD